MLPGIVGSLQALEVLKLVLGEGEPLVGRFLTFDGLALRFRELRLSPDPACPRCSADARRDPPPLAAAPDVACLTAEDEVIEPLPFQITVQELEAWRQEGRSLRLLDVREPREHQIACIDGADLVPLRTLPTHLDDLDRHTATVVYCHHGSRSAQAVAYLRQQGFDRVTNLGGGIDAWAVEIDSSVRRY